MIKLLKLCADKMRSTTATAPFVIKPLPDLRLALDKRNFLEELIHKMSSP